VLNRVGVMTALVVTPADAAVNRGAARTVTFEIK
jgi:hypothetical protein